MQDAIIIAAAISFGVGRPLVINAIPCRSATSNRKKLSAVINVLESIIFLMCHSSI
jgi:hypothetical protein